MCLKRSFDNAIKTIRDTRLIYKTALERNKRLSLKYGCSIYFKREDKQNTRSFKIRGAFNKISNLDYGEQIVTVSAGNHAQGVSLTCDHLNLQHNVFIPVNTPLQKIERITSYGNNNLTLHQKGNDFDESLLHAQKYCEKHNATLIHPFDDPKVILGQGTIAHEIYEDIEPDIIIVPIGGGGLISGIGLYSKIMNHKCKIYGVEPINANSMKLSLDNDKLTSVVKLDTFVDGASVRKVGDLTFEMCKTTVDNIFIINNNKLCYNMIDVYQNDGIVLEPAGCLSVSVLDQIPNIEGKNVVCILSGGNNDISRYSEIIEKSLLYQNLKHYFLIKFSQQPNELKKFINNIIGQHDDITRFEYLKKTNKQQGTVLLGIELQDKNDIHTFIEKMKLMKYDFRQIKENDLLYSYLV